jgi:hypothetical protein
MTLSQILLHSAFQHELPNISNRTKQSDNNCECVEVNPKFNACLITFSSLFKWQSCGWTPQLQHAYAAPPPPLPD